MNVKVYLTKRGRLLVDLPVRDHEWMDWWRAAGVPARFDGRVKQWAVPQLYVCRALPLLARLTDRPGGTLGVGVAPGAKVPACMYHYVWAD